MLGIRKAIKQQLQRVLGRPTTTAAPADARPPRPPYVPTPADADADDHGHSHEHGHSHSHDHAPVEVVAAPAAVDPEPVEVAPPDDVVGAGLTVEAVQEILDEMVRPAL